jgi:hypothetical protein
MLCTQQAAASQNQISDIKSVTLTRKMAFLLDLVLSGALSVAAVGIFSSSSRFGQELVLNWPWEAPVK